MAGGEDAKSSGEFGEKIAKKLLELIGWGISQKGFSIKCLEGEEHSNGKNPRVKHGIDYFFSYECPLTNNALEEVVVSVKHNKEGYPKYPSSTFKSHLKDIAHTIDCFEYDDDHRNANFNPNINTNNLTGVIFWFSNNPSEKEKGIIEEVYNFNNTDELQYGPVYLVDNKRAAFLVNSITYANNRYQDKDKEVNFVYPSTGYNDANAYSKVTRGTTLPVQYINSSILPLRVDEEGKGGILLLFVNEEFSEEGLKRLIGLAGYLTFTWAYKAIILFPDYNELLHNNIVTKVTQIFKDQSFITGLSVKSFLQDLQSLGEEENE